MKELFLYFFLCLAVTSCAVPRTVENNTFRAAFPEFVVNVSPEIKYFGNLKSSGLHDASGTGAKIREETDAYFFIMPDSLRNFIVVRGVVVGITEVEPGVRYVKGHIFFGFHYILERGTCLLSDEDYEFATYLWYPNRSQKITASLKDAGFIMPKCVLIRHQARIEYGNKIKFVDYWEDASQSGFACNKWQDERSLEAGQKAYLNEFNKRASEAFKIVDAVK